MLAISAGLWVVGIFLASSAAFSPSSASTACNDVGTWTTTCSVENTGSRIDIGAEAAHPGRDGTGGRGNGGSGSAPEPDREESPRFDDYGYPIRPGCETALCRDGYAVSTLPDVTLADLASFRPAAPALGSEPSGVGVVGMPTNLVAGAVEQHIPGSLFGYDVTVRFTPVGYRFVHGDGTSRMSTSPGASWSALGQAQFTPTATSHAYPRRGQYTVSVSVQYAAAVSFSGGSWRPVDGVVEVTGGGHTVQIVEARTALVDRTCAEDPGGPGC